MSFQLVRSAIDDIKKQFKVPIDPESYKVLKKKKYMGGVLTYLTFELICRPTGSNESW